MGRGGGKVAGAKSSVAKTGGSSTSSVTVSGPVDPKVLGLGFLILGVVFFICTIAVPISMVVNPSGTPCSSASSLNRNEQAICVPDAEQVGEDILVEYPKSADGFVKAYRAKKEQLVNNNVTRTYSWMHYQARLQGSYDYFSFSVPIGVVGYLNVICDETKKKEKCEDVKMYFLTKAEFDEAVDEKGEFHEKAFKKDAKGFGEDPSEYYFWANGRGEYVLVFSLKAEKSRATNVFYHVVLRYQVYDTEGMEEVECKKGECEIENIKEDEVVIADFVVPQDDTCKTTEEFPNLGVYCYDWCTNPKEYVCDGLFHGSSSKSSQPEYFDIEIHDLDINWSGVAAAAVIFALLTLLCFGLAALYLYKILKKIGKLGKKVAKKIDKMEEKNSTQMDAVSAQPQAAPAYPGQPDPAYAAAPYPGQM